MTDHAVLSALSNDVGFDVVFSRQLEAHGRPGDIALGLSTSGNSENLLRAFTQAAKQGMRTVGLSGYDGGRMAECPALEHCLVVRSDSVHRIQETQAAVAHALWAGVQAAYRNDVVDHHDASHEDASHEDASHEDASHDQLSHKGAE